MPDLAAVQVPEAARYPRADRKRVSGTHHETSDDDRIFYIEYENVIYYQMQQSK